MSSRTLRFDFSDRPRPPEPPANDLVEAPKKSGGGGLWDVGRRMTDLIQGAIHNPAGSGGQEDGSQPAESAPEASK
jgi:hypothetical protein